MTTKNKIFIGLAILFVIGISFAWQAYLVDNTIPQVVLGAANSRDTFSVVNLATTTSVGTAGVLVLGIPPTNQTNITGTNNAYLTGNAVYWKITNSGSVGVSCYPSATTTGLTYGGGWWAPASTTVEEMAGNALYIGPVSCLTGSGTTTLGIIAR